MNEYNFNWKMIIAVVSGVVVLGLGIVVGVKSIENKDKEAIKIVKETKEIEKEATKEKQEAKDVFLLSEDCEIWLNKNTNDDVKSVMLGMVPDDIKNKSEDEIRNYLANKYPENNIESITYGQILLSEKEEVKTKDIKNKYSLEVQDGFICLFKYDINGNRELKEKTNVSIDSLPQSVQEKIQQGMLMDNIDDAYSRLEEICS